MFWLIANMFLLIWGFVRQDDSNIIQYKIIELTVLKDRHKMN